MAQTSKVIKCRDYRWQGIERAAYKAEPAPFKAVTRQTLLGAAPGEERLHFVTRYFEVQPGGYTMLEMHEHPHAVIVLRGAGQVVLDKERTAIAPYDCVYVGPDTPHQFRADGTEPLGFLCVVDRVRDRPRVIEEEA